MERLTDFELEQFEQQLINDGTNTQVRKLIDEVKEYRQLAEQIGCPLEVYAQLKYDTPLFDQDGVKWFLNAISKDNFICAIRMIKKEGKVESIYRHFKVSDHKKTWWLKADKTE